MNTVLSTLRLFEEVALRQPIGVSELARVTQNPKSSVHRGLVTLQKAGWLRVVDPDRVLWGVTMKALTLGLRSAGEQDLREVAAPVTKRLSAETDETVHLGLRYDDELVVVAREDSTQVVRASLEVGSRLPLQVTSAGVAIMALLPDAEVESLIEKEPPGFAESPTLSVDELRTEVAHARERGYAANISSVWYRSRVASIASPITSSTGAPMGAVTLSLPGDRFDDSLEKPLAQLVVDAAREISDAVMTV